MTQIRNIYQVHDPELNQILQDIANRLDILEGLRPDLDAGYYNIDANKNLNTDNPVSNYQTIVSGIQISANKLLITDGLLEIDNGTLKVIAGSSAGSIEVYDSNNVKIHSME
jgi:hypothetical protein